jgi:RNA polymerase sigma-70 factor (ECF subfamily)
MEFQAFNESYVRRLAAGDHSIQDHFAAYFGELLRLKLRARVRSWPLIEDIRQETFRRVLESVQKRGAIERPERLGAYFTSVCNHVMSEAFRNVAKHVQIREALDDYVDNGADLDAALVTRERRQVVQEVLCGLSKRDRELLRMVYFDEEGKTKTCRRLRIRKEYLRVVLYRAKARFRERLARRTDF